MPCLSGPSPGVVGFRNKASNWPRSTGIQGVTRPFAPVVIALAALLLTACISQSRDTAGQFSQGADLEDLRQDFAQAEVDRPVLTWWHWINGNVTKDGITKDLETIDRLGLGGVILFSTGHFWPGDVPFASDAFWDHAGFAMEEADRLGLGFGMFNSDGWSQTGGPWITPEHAMKEIVWTETRVPAGTMVRALAQPATRELYEDIAVIAFPVPEGDENLDLRLSTTLNLIESPNLLDGNDQTRATVSFGPEGMPAEMTLDLGASRSLRSITFENLYTPWRLDAVANIAVSDDGQEFLTVRQDADLSLVWNEFAPKDLTLSFPEQRARFVRIGFRLDANRAPGIDREQKLLLGGVSVRSGARVDFAEAKAGFALRYGAYAQAPFREAVTSGTDDGLASKHVVDPQGFRDLTALMDGSGTLNWRTPSGTGDWIIQRVGYTLTLSQNKPATETGLGLESDKLSAAATHVHFNGYVGRMNALSRKARGRPLDYLQLESWEVKSQTWTPGFAVEFERRRGYELTPYLPVLTGGRIVGSYAESTRFLNDYRLTIAELVEENHWQVLYDLARADGIGVVLSEASGEMSFLYDGLRYMQSSDWSMGEFWVPETDARPDIRHAASIAAVRGTQIVAAEAFTAHTGEHNWRYLPQDLKYYADRAFATGANQFVLHSYVHQPYDFAPGFTLRRWGTPFNRLNPWFPEAVGFGRYLNRTQHLLQQGHYVADIGVLTGEGVPSYLGTADDLGDRVPEGYDYLGVSPDTLDELFVRDGRIQTPGGPSFAVLVLREAGPMSGETIRQLVRLVEAGATLVGPRPTGPYGLDGAVSARGDWTDLANQLWGAAGERVDRKVGSGHVVSGQAVADVLSSQGLAPDVLVDTTSLDEIDWIHRRITGSDAYFLASRSAKPLSLSASFRDGGAGAELWDPVSGDTRPVCVVQDGERARVDLELAPRQAVFLVFTNEAAPDCITPVFERLGVPATDWLLMAPRSREPELSMSVGLGDLSRHPVEVVSAPMGPLSLKRTFELASAPSGRVFLDLGDVRGIVGVEINGIPVGSVWTPPFRIEVSGLLRSGTNTIRLSLAGPIANALIDDMDRPADIETKIDSRGNRQAIAPPDWLDGGVPRPDGRRTFTTYDPFSSGSGPEPFGVFGPVSLLLQTNGK